MVLDVGTQLSKARTEAVVNAKATACVAQSARALKLATVITTFQKWLYLPDSLPLLAVLGTVAANKIEGDPVWLLLIGPPSGGKTELLHPLKSLDRVFVASTLTEAALLSGTPQRDKKGDSSGGLLRMIGSYGVLLCKDFTSVLSMNRDTRASVLAALREVYDGSWTRHLGTDGGRSLHWEGKVGFIGACTSAIDQHHTIISTMGERFIMFRLPAVDGDELAARALDHQGDENRMRPELSKAVRTLFDDLDLIPPAIDPAEKKRLIALSTLAVKCRSAVERDGHTREVELVPESEAPGRLALALSRLLAGVTALGASRADAWRVVAKVALDCVPALRLSVIRVLAVSSVSLETATVATAVRYPTGTTRRALEDLHAHGVVRRAGKAERNADLWRLSDWTVTKCMDADITFPEMSDGDPDQTFPEMSGKETVYS